MQEEKIRIIFKELLKNLVGFENNQPLGGVSIDKFIKNSYSEKIALVFTKFLRGETSEKENTIYAELLNAERVFCKYYADENNFDNLQTLIMQFRESTDIETKAFLLGKIFLPEITMTDSETIERWKLKSAEKNPSPINPDEVTIQLNALYSTPETISANVPEKLLNKWENIQKNGLTKIADYDHPVPLFENDDNHELVKCLIELNNDIKFEKEKGVFPEDKKFPVTISISVTHSELDQLASDWIEHLLRTGNYSNLKFFVLSEKNIENLKKSLFTEDARIFSVFGKYAVHFNALKYFQLILEKYNGIRAGFKLDTDEGIRSEDLYKLTGKTWLETLCHEFWGGQAIDPYGNEVLLGINEGEYIDSRDIDKYGYAKAAHMPEVKIPSSFISPMASFPKGYAQAFVTEIYNRFDNLNDLISHPVVKGGGYGITNDALKKSAQFTLSSVGRAEDQQFYFYGLTKGIRGIFHPNLRIAHYKASVQTSEKKQAATKFAGDMYRLIIFKALCDILEVKHEIDPFPGIFSGEMAEAQAAITLLYRAFCFSAHGDESNASILIDESLPEIIELKKEILSGEIKKDLEKEAELWKKFIQQIEKADTLNVKKSLDSIVIE